MLGIDLVQIARIEQMMQRFGTKALAKFLNEEEIKLVQNPSNAAGLFASKEAIAKALGVGIGEALSFKDICIYKNELKAPKVKVTDKLKNNFHIKAIHLSISHDAGFAVAAAFVLFAE